MTTSPTLTVFIVIGSIIILAGILILAYWIIKQVINDYRIDEEIRFPNIDEIEYPLKHEVCEYTDPKIGSFYIHKENAEKNPFIYPRFIYRIDSIKKNYYGEDWVKVSIKCYDTNSDMSNFYPVEYIPVKKFLEENSIIYKTRAKNIETYKQEKKKDYRKNMWKEFKKN